jgi:hypothetical protein
VSVGHEPFGGGTRFLGAGDPGIDVFLCDLPAAVSRFDVDFTKCF